MNAAQSKRVEDFLDKLPSSLELVSQGDSRYPAGWWITAGRLLWILLPQLAKRMRQAELLLIINGRRHTVERLRG